MTTPDPSALRARYLQDAEFAWVVDWMYRLIDRRDYSLADLKGAMLLATMMYLERHFNPGGGGHD